MDQGAILLRIARTSVARALGLDAPAWETAPWLRDPAATFVTIRRRGGELHGCIGSIVPRRSLEDDIVANAKAAAFEDPRSRRLRADELPHVHFEVSRLGPLEPISARSKQELLPQLHPHEDGLVLTYRTSRSLFLPQVWEQLSDPEAFLSALKEKAGLPASFDHPEIRYERFGVEKWSEDEKDASR